MIWYVLWGILSPVLELSNTGTSLTAHAGFSVWNHSYFPHVPILKDVETITGIDLQLYIPNSSWDAEKEAETAHEKDTSVQ